MAMMIGLGVLVLVTILLYNSVVARKNEVANAEGGLDASLKQRYDLIPNLVAATQEFMKHEKSVLQELTQLRSRALQPNLSVDQKQAINQSLSHELGKVMVSVENYPDLKSNTNMIQLQKSLHECEENIAASRRFYNAAVTSYNNALEMFPTSVFARMMNLQRAKVFEIAESERQNVSVKNLFKA